MNEFRVLVKSDSRTIREIAKETDLHPNTITRLIKYGGELKINSKSFEAAQKLAAFYGKRLKIKITLEPIEPI